MLGSCLALSRKTSMVFLHHHLKAIPQTLDNRLTIHHLNSHRATRDRYLTQRSSRCTCVCNDEKRQSLKHCLNSCLKILSVGGLSLLFINPAFGSVTTSLLTYQSSEIQQGVISAFLLILFSEIGDKTFFVALLLALQNSKTAVFTGTFGALAVMTLVSVGLGQALHQIDEVIPESVSQFPLDDILAIALLVWFGILTLQSAGNADARAAEEQEEAEEGVKGLVMGSSGLILSTFALVFSAEWGDKSFLATTALSAASSPLGVSLGALGGHFVATILAVLGGSFLSNYISEKLVQYIGGSLFLVFALTTSLDLFNQVSSLNIGN